MNVVLIVYVFIGAASFFASIFPFFYTAGSTSSGLADSGFFILVAVATLTSFFGFTLPYLAYRVLSHRWKYARAILLLAVLPMFVVVPIIKEYANIFFHLNDKIIERMIKQDVVVSDISLSTFNVCVDGAILDMEYNLNVPDKVINALAKREKIDGYTRGDYFELVIENLSPQTSLAGQMCDLVYLNTHTMGMETVVNPISIQQRFYCPMESTFSESRDVVVPAPVSFYWEDSPGPGVKMWEYKAEINISKERDSLTTCKPDWY